MPTWCWSSTEGDRRTGTHKELMAKGGLYADLYNRQFYQPEAETNRNCRHIP